MVIKVGILNWDGIRLAYSKSSSKLGAMCFFHTYPKSTNSAINHLLQRDKILLDSLKCFQNMDKYTVSLELGIFIFLENSVLLSSTLSFRDSTNFIILGVCKRNRLRQALKRILNMLKVGPWHSDNLTTSSEK